MTNIRLSWLAALASPVLLLATNAWAQQRPPIFEKVAKFADAKRIRVWFTDVAVKVTGSDKWLPAQ